MAINFKSVWEGLKIRAKAVLTSDEVGEIEVSSVDNKTYLHNGSTRSPIVTEAHTATLTNKTIDANGTGNSISNLETADLAAGVLNTSSTLAAASDTQIPSALAVKTYVDNGLAAQNEASEISYDNTTSGLTATNVQAAIDEVEGRLQTAETDISNHISDTVDAHDASAISFVPVGAVTATDVQSAIAEVDSDLTAHLTDTVDAHDASAISVVPTGNLAASDAQSAFNELQSNVDALYIDQNATDTALTNHITDTVDAHDASAISSVPAGNLAATDVQSALNELQTDIDTRATQSSLIDHITDLVDAHAASAIGFTPTGSLSSTNVQSAIAEVDSDLTAHISDTTPHATISGSSIQDPTRLDVKKDTLANLTTYATTATNGQIVFATDVKEMYQIVDNALVAVGSGGGTGIGVNQIAVQTFDDAVVGDFTQTGLELVTSSTIHGGQTARLIHQASSNYSFKQLIDVDRKFRGKSNTLSLSGYSTASSSNVTVLVTDETNSATLLSSTFTTGQITSAVFNTASSTTVTVTDNSILNQLSVGARITGSGIPTGTTITAVNSTAGTITISNAATATASGVSLKVSVLPNIQSYSFDVPSNCSSISYTISALQEAGSPETYVDDIVIELTEMAMTSASVTVPKNNNYSVLIQSGIIVGATTTAPTKGTTITDRIIHSRMENRLIADYQLDMSTAGSSGSGDYLYSLPTGLSFDLTAITPYSAIGVPLSPSEAKALVGYGEITDGGNVFDSVKLIAYSSTQFRALVNLGASSKAFASSTYTNFSANLGYGFHIDAPIAGWKTNETETKTIPLSSSVIVTEPDSYLKVTGTQARGTTLTQVARFSSIASSVGSAISYMDSASNGASFTVLEDGEYTFRFQGDIAGANGSVYNLYITKNTTLALASLTSSDDLLIASEVGVDSQSAELFDSYSVVGSSICKAGDIIRFCYDGPSTLGAGNNVTFATITKVGSTKILNPSSDQKVEIPTHELRFEGASARGSVATAIVKFDTLAKIKGDGFEVINTAADGTVVTIKKAGILSGTCTIRNSSSSPDVYITLNKSVLTSSSPTLQEILCYNEGAAATFSSGTAFSNVAVKVGDKIRVSTDSEPNGPYNFLSLSLQEQSVAVALQNVAPRWDDSDSAIELQNASYFVALNRFIDFSNIVNNIGGAISYTSNPSTFTVMENGNYNISAMIAFAATGGDVAIVKNSPNINQSYKLLPAAQILDSVTASGVNHRNTLSANTYLLKGDTIRIQTENSPTLGSAISEMNFRITKVGKTQGTVDVTPFVQIPQNEVESVTHSASASTLLDTSGEWRFALNNFSTTNRGILKIEDDIANTRTKFVAVRDCVVDINFTASQTTIANGINIYKNGALFQQSNNNYAANTGCFVATSISLNAGEFITLGGGTPSSDPARVSITATAISPSIATPTEQVSSDTIPFVFKATAITDSDPVGTFNTYSKAVNSYKSSVLNSTPPTQSISSMNINGVQVFAAPYNAGTSASQPSRFDIKIGKGLKSTEISGYGGLNKTLSAFLDTTFNGGAAYFGLPVKYEESTGVLSFDAGMNSNTTNTLRFFDTDGNYTNGYVVFNASKSPSLVSIPNLQQRVAIVKYDTPSARMTLSTSYAAVPLTSVQDPTGFVSLNANQITLQAGQYLVDINAYFYMNANTQSGFSDFRNVTDSITEFRTTVAYTGTAGSNESFPVSGSKIITITSQKTFEYRARASTGTPYLGDTWPETDGADKAIIKITKIK